MLWLTGIGLLIIYLGFRSHSFLLSRLALWQFRTSQQTSAKPVAPAPSSRAERFDFSLWSPKRVQAFQESLALVTSAPIAVLTIPRLGLTVPVFEGTDDLTLNRGLGRVSGTGQPGDGNLAIAGHRDGFFRVLKDITPGDAIEVVTNAAKNSYVVDRIEIVTPDDVSVLAPSQAPTVTLITCYPFYFVGDAPRRFIVEASLKARSAEPMASPVAYRQPSDSR